MKKERKKGRHFFPGRKENSYLKSIVDGCKGTLLGKGKDIANLGEDLGAWGKLKY